MNSEGIQSYIYMYPFSPWICVFSELFQNSLILWVYLHVSLQYCWEPAWGVPPIAKVMRLRGLTGKGESGLREPHWICSCICPKNQSLPALLHYAFHLYFWHYRGLSPTTSLCKGVNLGLQLINLLGVFQSKNSSDGSLACLTGLSGHNPEKHEML